MKLINKIFAFNLVAIILVTGIITSFSSCASAQSPAAQAGDTIGGKAITVKYAAPSVRSRQIFGDGGLVSKDRNYPVWRAGANAATSLHTDADLDIKGLQVPKGDYTLYVDVSNPDQWVLIVNKQTGQWGLTYDKTKDLGRVNMDMTKPAALIETLKYSINEAGNNKATLKLEWENHIATVPVTIL